MSDKDPLEEEEQSEKAIFPLTTCLKYDLQKISDDDDDGDDDNDDDAMVTTTFVRKFFKFLTFRLRDRFGPKIIKIRAILAIFRLF